MTSWRRRIARALGRVFELQDPAHARLLPMEGLRGAAVTLVFLQHAGMQALMLNVAPGLSRYAADIMRHLGNLGVELFFVLSGYLIHGTLVRRRPRFSAFMLRRAQRLYPAFLTVFALAAALQVLTRAMPPAMLLRPAYLLANLLFLPGLFPVTPVVTVAWSLSYEVFFYGAAAGLVLAGQLWRLPRQGRIAILLGLGVLFCAGAAAGPAGYPVRMLPFLAGMLLAEGAGANVPDAAAAVCPALAFLCLGALELPELPAQVIVSAAFFALCAVCFRGSGRIAHAMAWTPLRWLGNMSYSYYLLHGYVVRAGSLVLKQLWPGGEPAAVFWLSLPLLYAATLVCSAMLFLCIEKPLSLWMPRKTARSGAGTVAPEGKAIPS